MEGKARDEPLSDSIDVCALKSAGHEATAAVVPTARNEPPITIHKPAMSHDKAQNGLTSSPLRAAGVPPRNPPSTPDRVVRAVGSGTPPLMARLAYIAATQTPIPTGFDDLIPHTRPDPRRIIAPVPTGCFAEASEDVLSAGLTPVSSASPAAITAGITPKSSQQSKFVYPNNAQSALNSSWFDGKALDEESSAAGSGILKAAPVTPERTAKTSQQHGYTPPKYGYIAPITYDTRSAASRVGVPVVPSLISGSPLRHSSAAAASLSEMPALTATKTSQYAQNMEKIHHAGPGVAVIPSPPAPMSPRTARAALWLDSGVLFSALRDAAEHPPEYFYSVTGFRKRKPKPHISAVGVKVVLNGQAIAVFKYRGAALAFSARCPHAGGDLSLGDIEDFDGKICVCCPSHGFLFDCGASGKSVSPQGSYAIQTYPARITPQGSVEIGFVGLHASIFSSDDF